MIQKPDSTLIAEHSPRRVLVIQTAFLGDLVLTTPLLSAVNRSWPKAEIFVLAHKTYAGVLHGQPMLSGIRNYDKHGAEGSLRGMASVIRDLRAWRCDLALLPHRSFRSGLIAWLAGIPLRVGFEGTPGSMFYTHRVFRNPTAHERRRNLALLEAFGIEPAPHRPILFPGSDDQGEVDQWLKANRLPAANPIALAPGSVWTTKRWPAEYWRQLAAGLVQRGAGPVVLIGGRGDRQLAEAVAEKSGNGVFSAAGRLSLLASGALIGRSRLLITGDTAPLHLAQAFDTMTLAIFGPTVPEFGFGPTGDDDRVIGMDLACRPCAIHGGSQCPLGHHDCMKKLPPSLVLHAALDMLRTGFSSESADGRESA